MPKVDPTTLDIPMQSVSIVHVTEFKFSEALSVFSIAFIRGHVLQSQRMGNGEVKGDLV